MDGKRIREISQMPKTTLARMHLANGGLMPLADYLRWSHDELVKAVIEDETGAGPRSGIQPDTTP